MSAERLREAAALMREHNPPCCGMGDVCCQGVTFHHAVADWLDVFSDGEWPYCDCGDEDCNYGPCIAQRRAIDVANAYLGSD